MSWFSDSILEIIGWISGEVVHPTSSGVHPRSMRQHIADIALAIIIMASVLAFVYIITR